MGSSHCTQPYAPGWVSRLQTAHSRWMGRKWDCIAELYEDKEADLVRPAREPTSTPDSQLWADGSLHTATTENRYGQQQCIEPQFYQTGHSKGSRHLDPREKCVFLFRIKVSPQCCSVQKSFKKKHVSTHIHPCVYKMSVQVGGDGLPARWGLMPKRSYRSDRLCPTFAQVSSPKQVSLKTKSQTKQRVAGEQLQQWLPAQTHSTDLGWGKGGQSSQRWHAGNTKPNGTSRTPAHIQTA